MYSLLPAADYISRSIWVEARAKRASLRLVLCLLKAKLLKVFGFIYEKSLFETGRRCVPSAGLFLYILRQAGTQVSPAGSVGA